MKRFIRLVCLLLVFASLASIPAYATENSAKASNYLSSYRAYCTINYAGSLSVSYQVIGAGNMDEIGVRYIKVQYSSDLVNWSDWSTFTPSYYPSMIRYNSAFHSGVLTSTVPTGYYYRAYVEFYAAKGNGFAERYYYTDAV